MHASLSTPDILALVVYLGALVVIGFWVSRKVKSMEDFVMPKRFGKVLMITFSFGTGTHADEAVGVSSKSFTNGVSGIWYQWLYLFCTPFYWLIAPMMKRFRAITTADIYEARYGRSMAYLYTLIGILTLIVDLGTILKAFGAVVHGSTGIPANTAITVVVFVFVIYSVAGGLVAGIITDFIQGILTVIFSFILLPFVLSAVGGMSGLHSKISDPHLWSMVAPGDIGVFYIAMLSVTGLIGIVTQPHILANCSAGRTEMDGRVGFMCGNMVKRICTMAWCLIGFAAIAYFAGRNIEPDQVWGHIAKDFLSKAAPGLLGIFLATLLASLQSMANAVMICSSGLFTENIYKKFAKGKSNAHYLLVARIASVVTVACAVTFAYKVEGVVKGLEIFWRTGILLGIAFWLGLFWKRANLPGAWASFLAAAVAWYLSENQAFVNWLAGFPLALDWRFVVVKAGVNVMYLPWANLFFIAAGLGAGIIVSLLTKPTDEKRVENYYALVRTPIKQGEVNKTPCTIPEGVEVPPRNNLFPDTSLEFQKPSWTGFAGFMAGWAYVLLLIGAFYFITKM